MAQVQTGVSTKSDVAPNNTLDHTEFNALNDTVNANSVDAESRLTTIEGSSAGILSYDRATLLGTIASVGTIALDTTSDELVYYKTGGWHFAKNDNLVVAAAPWTPAAISAAYWWDSADAGTIADTAGAVSSWTDKNQGVAIGQLTGVNQPVTNSQNINGVNVIDFLGDDYLEGPVLAFSEFSRIIVTEPNSSSGGNLLSNVNGVLDALFEENTGFMKLYQAGTSVVISTTPFTPGVPQLVGSTTAANGDCELFINGTSEGTANAPLGGGTQPIQLGVFYGATFMDGQIGDVVLLPSVATSDERQRTEGYLAHKFSITTSLPAGHPYKSSPPLI